MRVRWTDEPVAGRVNEGRLKKSQGVMDKAWRRCERPCVHAHMHAENNLMTNNRGDNERRERLTGQRWYRGRAAAVAKKLVLP